MNMEHVKFMKLVEECKEGYTKRYKLGKDEDVRATFDVKLLEDETHFDMEIASDRCFLETGNMEILHLNIGEARNLLDVLTLAVGRYDLCEGVRKDIERGMK